jgi:hypothetical protein
VHRDVLRQGLVDLVSGQSHEHAELAARVHVAPRNAGAVHRQSRDALDDHVLSEPGDRGRDALRDLLAVDRRVQQRGRARDRRIVGRGARQ